jgi:hypothetical protein
MFIREIITPTYNSSSVFGTVVGAKTTFNSKQLMLNIMPGKVYGINS